MPVHSDNESDLDLDDLELGDDNIPVPGFAVVRNRRDAGFGLFPIAPDGWGLLLLFAKRLAMVTFHVTHHF